MDLLGGTWRVKVKESLFFLILALAGSSVVLVVLVFSVPVLVLVMLLVLVPIWAELPTLEVARGSSCLPGDLADMSRYPLFSDQRVVPSGGALALGGVLALL